jgi:cytochrome c oxidase assembly protein subunit 15
MLSQRLLSRFAKLVVLATLALIYLGALVTSRGAGLAVPDWPTTFGYNMFLYPVSGWKDGVFYEHTHRLVASGVGLLTTVLAVWIWRADTRAWVRRLGVAAFLLVVVQGIFGGLRVTKLSIVLAMIHGCVAQAFLCVTIVLAIALSPSWRDDRGWLFAGNGLRSVRNVAWALVGSVYVQLVLGAVMRHKGAGLAITDFPLAFGHVIPPIHSLATGIHFAHRVGALCVTIVTGALLAVVLARAAHEWRLLSPVLLIAALVTFQIALGAHIIWLMRPPVTTTLHVANGAAILGTALLLAVRTLRFETSESSLTAQSERHSSSAIPA